MCNLSGSFNSNHAATPKLNLHFTLLEIVRFLIQEYMHESMLYKLSFGVLTVVKQLLRVGFPSSLLPLLLEVGSTNHKLRFLGEKSSPHKCKIPSSIAGLPFKFTP